MLSMPVNSPSFKTTYRTPASGNAPRYYTGFNSQGVKRGIPANVNRPQMPKNVPAAAAKPFVKRGIAAAIASSATVQMFGIIAAFQAGAIAGRYMMTQTVDYSAYDHWDYGSKWIVYPGGIVTTSSPTPPYEFKTGGYPNYNYDPPLDNTTLWKSSDSSNYYHVYLYHSPRTSWSAWHKYETTITTTDLDNPYSQYPTTEQPVPLGPGNPFSEPDFHQ